MIGRTGCRATEEKLAGVALRTLATAERLDVELHISACARCARTLRALEVAGAAYDQAFARLRSRRVLIAPGRARLAAATKPRVGFAFLAPSRVLRLRLAEAAVAFGVMTLAVVGSGHVEPSRAVPPSPSQAAAVVPAAAAPQPEDSQSMRAMRLKYREVDEIVSRVTAGRPH